MGIFTEHEEACSNLQTSNLISALAKWLNIKPDEVKNYKLTHRCKPLNLADLLQIFDKEKE